MADIIKPAPLRLGDRYYYSLTSYDPVSIEIKVPRVTEDDISMALLGMATEVTMAKAAEAAREAGAEPQMPEPLKLADITDVWLAENMPEAASVAELREDIRKQLTQVNAQMAEESKSSRAVEALAERLAQSVPQDEIARARAAMQQSLENDLAANGLNLEQYLAQIGGQRTQIEAMLDANAKTIAEQDAALSAYVSEKKIKVEEAELPQYLGMSLDQAQEFIEQARSHGQMQQLLHSAAQSKALRILVAEASCAYVQETPEEAEQRTAQYRDLLEGEAPKRRPEFKLV